MSAMIHYRFFLIVHFTPYAYEQDISASVFYRHILVFGFLVCLEGIVLICQISKLKTWIFCSCLESVLSLLCCAKQMLLLKQFSYIRMITQNRNF